MSLTIYYGARVDFERSAVLALSTGAAQSVAA
jgi:hypothetical protein